MNAPAIASSSKMMALYGLKWNPFLPSVPAEGAFPSPRIDSFARRCEMYLRDGGFAMLTGAPGVGKSITLRLLHDRLARMRDVLVRAISHPQSRAADFYRELGDLFGVALSPHNRWGGFKAVREKWQAHIDATLIRPVLVIDEAQEMQASVLNELRLLASRDYDSHALLFVVLAGDGRLIEKLRTEDLLPLRSRIRTHLDLEVAPPAELADCLRHVVAAAGNAQLLTPSLVTALSEHAAGSYRTLMSMAADLLAVGAERDARQLDEKLFFEVFAIPAPPPTTTPKGKRR
jgi:type II secretory pathway predicted ATPase ExeA